MTKQDQSLVVSSVTLPRAAVCLVLVFGNMAGWMSEKYGKVASVGISLTEFQNVFCVLRKNVATSVCIRIYLCKCFDSIVESMSGYHQQFFA